MGEPVGGRINHLGTIVDFWNWAYSDLRANNVRGVFAEWLVARLLDIEPAPRGSWEDYDLRLPDGRTIEVKASAYLQTWHRPGATSSIIQFTGLKGQSWDDALQRRTSGAAYKADLYVFCVQTEKDPKRWNAFDLAQWDFYVLPRAQLEARGSSSLRLSVVQRLASPVAAEELRQTIGQV